MRTEQFEEVINNRKETQENAAEIERYKGVIKLLEDDVASAKKKRK